MNEPAYRLFIVSPRHRTRIEVVPTATGRRALHIEGEPAPFGDFASFQEAATEAGKTFKTIPQELLC